MALTGIEAQEKVFTSKYDDGSQGVKTEFVLRLLPCSKKHLLLSGFLGSPGPIEEGDIKAQQNASISLFKNMGTIIMASIKEIHHFMNPNTGLLENYAEEDMDESILSELSVEVLMELLFFIYEFNGLTVQTEENDVKKN